VSSAVVYLVWGLLGLAALGLWLRSRSSPASVAGPGEVLERIATGPILRVVIVVFWMFAGWHLFAR
jgi:MYXO-CTERM domain-containing protein